MAGPTDERPGSRLEVREPAEFALRIRCRLGHHLGVEAQAGHDHEDVPVAVPAQPGGADVDGAVVAPQGDPQRPLGLVEDDVEVAREYIAGADGDDAHRRRRARQHRGDRADRAVAAGDDDDVDLGLESLLGHALTRIGGGGLEDQRRIPAFEPADRPCRGDDVLGIRLRPVDDERRAVAGGGVHLGVGRGMGAGVPVETVEGTAGTEPGADEEGGDDDDDDSGDDEPRHGGIKIEGHGTNLLWSD